MSDVVELASKVATPKAAGVNIELGVETTLPFDSWGAQSGSELYRRDSVSLDALREMVRRDGQARSLSRLFVLPILSAFADGRWVSSDGNDSEEVDFANQMWTLPPAMGGMTSSRFSVLKKTLKAFQDGFSVFEEVRQIPEDGPLAGKVTLRKLAYRDSQTVKFRVDAQGGFDGIRQVASVGAKTVDVVIPKERSWFWTCNVEENPFYGVSLFEAAYYHYEIKRKLYYIAHLAAQFGAVPGRIGTIPQGASPQDIAAFKRALSDFAFNTAMVKRAGFEVTPFQAGSSFNFIPLIDHHNLMMSKSVLAAFMDSEQRAALVEVGRVDPSADFFVLALEAFMDDIAESWSTFLMPKYIDMNFGTKNYPVFKFGSLSSDAKTTVKDVFTSVVTSSVLNSTPEFVRELEKKLAGALDLDIDYDEIEKQEKLVAEEQAAAQESEAQQMMSGQWQPPDGESSPGSESPPPSDVTPSAADSPQPGASESAAMSATIDDLVQAAQALLLERPEPEMLS